MADTPEDKKDATHSSPPRVLRSTIVQTPAGPVVVDYLLDGKFEGYPLKSPNPEDIEKGHRMIFATVLAVGVGTHGHKAGGRRFVDERCPATLDEALKLNADVQQKVQTDCKELTDIMSRAGVRDITCTTSLQVPVEVGCGFVPSNVPKVEPKNPLPKKGGTTPTP
jgi:hypothetical protein